MSYTYGHEQAKKKPTDLFQKLVSQGSSTKKAKSLVRHVKKKQSNAMYRATNQLIILQVQAMQGKKIDKKSYKSNYLPDLSTNKPGKYGVDY